jgi:predicted acylesterase/phospholipase RssA
MTDEYRAVQVRIFHCVEIPLKPHWHVRVYWWDGSYSESPPFSTVEEATDDLHRVVQRLQTEYDAEIKWIVEGSPKN